MLGFIIGEIRAWEFGSTPCGWVFALSVEPEMRLHNVGTALFEAISSEFKKAGVEQDAHDGGARCAAAHAVFPQRRHDGRALLQLEKDLD